MIKEVRERERERGKEQRRETGIFLWRIITDDKQNKKRDLRGNYGNVPHVP